MKIIKTVSLIALLSVVTALCSFAVFCTYRDITRLFGELPIRARWVFPAVETFTALVMLFLLYVTAITIWREIRRMWK